MKNTVLIILLLFFSIGTYGQVDQSGKTTTVKGLGLPEENKNSILKIEEKKRGLFYSTRKPITLSEPEEKTFSMRTDADGLLDYKMEGFVPKAFTKDKEIKEAYSRDQYLGDVKTGGSFVELYCRDHEYVDGDRVRVYVNDELVNPSVSLGSGYTPILVKLKTGFNTVVFEALNMGASGPNTAELKILDEMGNLLTTKEWNLTTGTKATLIVVKQ